MKNQIRVAFYSLVTLGALVSCESSNQEMPVGSAEPLLDGSGGLEQVYLPTGVNSSESDNSWFCTYTENSQYVDRKEINFWENGDAMVDGAQGTWSFGNDALIINYSGISEQFGAVKFSRRFSNADRFMASSDVGTDIACDWSGPPRLAGFLADGSNTLSIEDISRSSIDVLLSNGRSDIPHESYWLCQRDLYLDSDFELYLFDDGSMISTMQGRWSRESESSIKFAVNGSVELWSNIQISSDTSGNRYGYFSADSEFSGPVKCQWSGKPRASAWVSSE